jgi:hypothetical protein
MGIFKDQLIGTDLKVRKVGEVLGVGLQNLVAVTFRPLGTQLMPKVLTLIIISLRGLD